MTAGFYIKKSAHRLDITVSNPEKRNAVTRSMWEELPDIMEAAGRDPDIRVIVISGDGCHFVSGADIAEFRAERSTPATAAAYEKVNERAFAAVRQCPKPVVAMIRGFCIGGGFGIAAACDLRIADETAEFCLPPARLGIVYPPQALADIVNLIGISAAKDLVFTARMMKAEEALRLGFLNRLVQPDALEETMDSLAGQIARTAPMTNSATKKALEGIQMALRTHYAEELEDLATACLESADCAEGRNAFLEKRAPLFRGN